MRIAIAFSAALIGTTAVADDAVHLRCTGTQFASGFNNNIPWPATVSLVVYSDFVQGSDGIGGRIIKSDDQSIDFMAESYVVHTNDNWKTSTKFDVCIYGSINRVTGKAGVMRTYGKCDPVNGPPREPLQLNSSYDLICTVVKRLF
jgi:hypothetical protein